MAKAQRSINRIAATAFGLAACAFLALSLLSFHVTDWPNPDVAPAGAVENLCGPTGAFLAYQCNYYLGPASLPLLALAMIWLVIYCRHRPVDQPILRTIGVLLIGATFSASVYLVRPGSENSLAIGNGGVLGIALGHFLLTNMALTGAVLVLLATFVVGMLLAADHVLFGFLRWLGHGLSFIAQSGPALASAAAGARTSVVNRTATLAPRPNKTWAIPQRDAAIQAVTSLPADETETDSAEADDEPETTADLEVAADTKARDAETAAAPETAADKQEDTGEAESAAAPPPDNTNVQAVSTALAQMMGRRPRPTHAPQSNEPDYTDYRYPELDLLAEPVYDYSEVQDQHVRRQAEVLSQTLKDFNINAQVVNWDTGPVITMYELQLAPGIKVAQISNLANDLARSLGAAAVRVVAPIPGKHTIGIEVPNSQKEKVRIKELLQISGAKVGKMNIPLFLGKDASGEPLVVDLTSMPHCLIAGTTGSGKSVCMNTIIISVLMTQRPDMVKLILVDPKMVEMNSFRDLAHLMCPIVTEMKRAEQILEWLTVKMDERYALLAEARVRNIDGYNKLTPDEIYERFCPSNEEEKLKIPLRLPYLVIMIDELADLMMTSAKEVEAYIIRLAQKSRAVGIHLVLATQRPQATVVTGLIKSNLPCRISFRVSQRMDSRIVLDQNGAETLLGQGDMLFLQPGTSELVRAQGTFVSDDEIHAVVKHLRETAQPHYSPELVQLSQMSTDNIEKDELFDEAVKVVLETRRGSVSLLQRRLTIGYSRASRLIDQMALAGIVGEYKGSQAREVLITPEEYAVIQAQMAQDASDGYQDLQEPPTPPPGAGAVQVADAAPAALPAAIEPADTPAAVEPDEFLEAAVYADEDPNTAGDDEEPFGGPIADDATAAAEPVDGRDDDQDEDEEDLDDEEEYEEDEDEDGDEEYDDEDEDGEYEEEEEEEEEDDGGDEDEDEAWDDEDEEELDEDEDADDDDEAYADDDAYDEDEADDER